MAALRPSFILFLIILQRLSARGSGPRTRLIPTAPRNPASLATPKAGSGRVSEARAGPEARGVRPAGEAEGTHLGISSPRTSWAPSASACPPPALTHAHNRSANREMSVFNRNLVNYVIFKFK